MAKYVINGRFLEKDKIGGVQRFAIEILKNLDRILKKDELEILISNFVEKIPNYENIKITRYSSLKGNAWEQLAFGFYLIKNKKIGINLCNTFPIYKTDIVCIHDINCIINPNFFKMKFRIWYTILYKIASKRAKQILTVSDFSKRELMKKYKIQDKKITVLGNGWEHIQNINEDENIFKQYKQLKKQEYFFALGNINKNKNMEYIIKLAKKYPEFEFVIGGEENKKIFGKINYNIEETSNITYIGYTTDEKVKTLMQNSKAFIFPSFYEGFGIPILEALSSGCKIIASNTSCIPEIFQDTIYYISPYDGNIDLVKILKEKLEPPNKILKIYTWKNAAIKLERLLKMIF